MTREILKKRFLEKRLPEETKRTIVLLTGARQTGKITLAKKKYSNLRYINFDSIEDREKIKIFGRFLLGGYSLHSINDYNAMLCK
jgi:predicted AAA+ superfamily ATPase